jgi:hypothetical protein
MREKGEEKMRERKRRSGPKKRERMRHGARDREKKIE